ncbi:MULTISPECIES: helix-turn-helix domain-containing protein [Thermus]|uniref:DNA-binding protein n=1 Tax=Thermus tengchongensis TaxID=1214928 RepID=A0A4Y9F7E1_9DEIN|nr:MULTISPECIES: helix-turn-helix domain-containing protein [Thermus]TFU24985.1 DNA-binding protein [Thermus tengchongensis]
MAEASRKEKPGAGEEIPKDPLAGKLLLTYEEVQKALGVSRSTVWRLIQAGHLRLVHPTRRTARITRESLEAFLRSLEAPEKAEKGGKGVVDRAREVLKRFGL